MTAAAEKHTPGPWDYEFGHPMQSGIRYWQAHNGQDAICSNQFCYAANGDEAASEANARLIAAAPDLLEALRGVLRIADRSTVEFDAARAAIARASSTA